MKRNYKDTNTAAGPIKQEANDTNRVRMFWQTDLAQVEECFLKGRKITDLPIRKPDNSTPSQGSVLLGRVRNIDKAVIMPKQWMARILRLFHSTI